MQSRAIPYPRAPLYFVLLLAVAFVGFYPSYFSRLRETDAVHHFHGVMATIWILMLITQGWLMRRRDFSAHRLVGRASFVVAPLFVFSGLLVVRAMLASDDAFARIFGARLAFADLTTLGYFCAAYGLAVRYRRNTALHARFLASTAILVLPPALARALAFCAQGDVSFPLVFHGAFAISELIVAALIVDDWRDSRVRAPYPILLVLLLVQQLAFVLIPAGSPG
jgi:hypothetical protein